MTVYARSDISYVGLTPDHGGCGQSHSRPVVQGAPVKVWALDCPPCEDHLRSDPLWSSQPTTIPETVDEKNAREDIERRGQLEQAASTAEALNSLSKLGDLPQVMAQFMSFLAGQQPAGLPVASMDRLCRNGHRNASAARFCTECGAGMDEGVPSDRGPELPTGAGHRMSSSQGQELRQALQSMDGDPAFDHQVEVKPPVEEAVPANLDELPLTELKAIAERLGVKTTRSKADQIAAIREHQGV